VNSRYREDSRSFAHKRVHCSLDSAITREEAEAGGNIGDIEANLIAPTHLMKRRGRMMVLPGRDRVRTDAGVGAGKINGQDFAAARRRAYRV